MYRKTKKLGIPVSPEVASFAVCLEFYLESRGLDLLESWEGVPITDIVSQLRSKILELDPAKVNRANPRALFERAVILGCYCMMLCELAYQRSNEKKSAGVLFFPVTKERMKA